MKTVSQQISNYLSEHGIDTVFGVTGGGAMFINYAMASHSNIKTVFMHHEQACAMAAEGYARITGKPAIVMVTTGPGAINAMNGVYGAYTDSIPMIVISGQVKRETCQDFYYGLENLRQLGDQEGPTIRMVSPITKSAVLIREPKELEYRLPEAVALCQSGRPGPVWLDIPIDVQNSKEQLDWHVLDKVTNPIPSQSQINLCIDLLQKAKKPLILAGTGIRLAGAVDDLVSFAEKTNIPIATAWTHDLISSNHPLFAGRPGTIGTRAGNFCLQSADLVFIIGSRCNIRQTGYNWKNFAGQAITVHIDIDNNELNKPTFKAQHNINADAKQFIQMLNLSIDNYKLPNFKSWVKWCKNINNKYQVVHEHKHKSDQVLNPYLIVDLIFKHLRDNDIIVSGNASACIIPGQVGVLLKNQRLFSNSGSASMGYDLPAAIGAACVDRRRIICFAGDGSLHMNIQELQTVKTYNLNIVIVVLNNNGYLSIKQTHENFFGTVYGATPSSGIEFPDYTKLSDVYGIPAVTLKTRQDIDNLPKLLNLNGPRLINIMVDPDQGFAPRMKARLDSAGNFVPLELDDMFPFIPKNELLEVRESSNDL